MRSIVRASLPLLIALGVSAPSALYAGSNLSHALIYHGATGQNPIEQSTIAYKGKSQDFLDQKSYFAQVG